MGLICPDCGNEKSFLAKTLQIHVVQASQAELYGYETPNWPSDHAAVVVDVDIAGAP